MIRIELMVDHPHGRVTIHESVGIPAEPTEALVADAIDAAATRAATRAKCAIVAREAAA